MHLLSERVRSEGDDVWNKRDLIFYRIEVLGNDDEVGVIGHFVIICSEGLASGMIGRVCEVVT